MQEMVVNYLKDLDISIKKKMFFYGKKEKINNPPSPLQVRIFLYLYEHDKEVVSPTDLVKALRVSKVTISEALTKMENNGNIIIKESEHDGRKKILEYTNKSKKCMEAMVNTLMNVNKELTKNISDEEIQVFINIIKKMKNNLEEE